MRSNTAHRRFQPSGSQPFPSTSISFIILFTRPHSSRYLWRLLPSLGLHSSTRSLLLLHNPSSLGIMLTITASRPGLHLSATDAGRVPSPDTLVLPARHLRMGHGTGAGPRRYRTRPPRRHWRLVPIRAAYGASLSSATRRRISPCTVPGKTADRRVRSQTRVLRNRRVPWPSTPLAPRGLLQPRPTTAGFNNQTTRRIRCT